MDKAQAKNLTSADGRVLAAAMLREAETLSERGYLQESARNLPKDTAQENLAMRYLDAMAKAKNRDVLTGFAEVLSDFLCAAYDGAVPSPDEYESQV